MNQFLLVYIYQVDVSDPRWPPSWIFDFWDFAYYWDILLKVAKKPFYMPKLQNNQENDFEFLINCI